VIVMFATLFVSVGASAVSVVVYSFIIGIHDRRYYAISS